MHCRAQKSLGPTKSPAPVKFGEWGQARELRISTSVVFFIRRGSWNGTPAHNAGLPIYFVLGAVCPVIVKEKSYCKEKEKKKKGEQSPLDLID